MNNQIIATFSSLDEAEYYALRSKFNLVIVKVGNLYQAVRY